MGVANISGNILTDSGASLSSYLPLTGGTLTGALNGTSATFSGEIKSGDTITLGAAAVGGFWTWGSTISYLVAGTGKALNLNPNGASGTTGLSIATSGLATFSNSIVLSATGYVGFGGGNNYMEGDNANNILRFGTNNVTRVTINASGNVGIGTSSPDGRLSVKQANSLDYRGLLVIDSATPNWIGLAHTGSAGVISVGYDGAGAYYPMVFKTSDTERMRITSGGGVVVGSTLSNPTGLETGWWLKTSSEARAYYSSTREALCVNRYNSTGSLITFDYQGSGISNISTNGSTISYNTGSDYRIKEDFKEVNGLEKLQKIKVYNFKFKGTENIMDGVIAHELQEIIPYAVNGEKDAIDEDGKMIIQGVDYSLIVPVLVKAIQEQQEIINHLSAKVTALENK